MSGLIAGKEFRTILVGFMGEFKPAARRDGDGAVAAIQ